MKSLYTTTIVGFLAGMIQAQTFSFTDPERISFDSTQNHFGGHPTPCITDWDKDGVKDLLVGRWGNGYGDFMGTIGYFRNTGSNENPVYHFEGDIASGMKSV